MMTADCCLLYVTASDQEEAGKLAETLVEERLVACVNILGAITSVYCWEGKVEKAGEIVLLLKTRRDLVPAVTSRITDLHSYECPCVVALPVTGGNPAFLKWIGDETSTAQP